MTDISPVMLYLDSSQTCFIYLKTPSQVIYMNLASPELTRQLLDDLKTRITP